MSSIVWFATKGDSHTDAARIAELLSGVHASPWSFDPEHKGKSMRQLLARTRAERPDLVVMEGTGIAGGLTVLIGRLRWGVPYVVSSGDAVGPYLRLRVPGLGPPGALYEWLLYRLSSGFIGWTPYLAGRGLTLGAPRAMTAPNWAGEQPRDDARALVRKRLSIPPDAVVFGLAGTLRWNARASYCYGVELVRALGRSRRDDVRVLIVGDGSGRERLADLAGERVGNSVLLPGRVPHEQVADYLAAMDVASLPQSLDRVGAFRYTTKLSEYLTAGLPIVTGQLPWSYDLSGDWLWRLPGRVPWSDEYTFALASLIDAITPEEVAQRRATVPRNLELFDRERQTRAVQAFLSDILESH